MANNKIIFFFKLLNFIFLVNISITNTLKDTNITLEQLNISNQSNIKNTLDEKINNIPENQNINNNTSSRTRKSNYTSLFLTSKIPSLFDKNFDFIVEHNRDKLMVVLFTLRGCGPCNRIISSYENASDYFSKLNNSKFVFYKVDCLNSSWTAMRFDLDRIPKIIIVENASKYSLLNENITTESIIDYLKNPNKIYFPYPSQMTYIKLFIKVFNTGNEYFTKFLNDKGYSWNKNYSIIALVLFVMIIGYIERKFINLCCKKKKDEKSKINKHGKNNHEKRTTSSISKNKVHHHLHNE